MGVGGGGESLNGFVISDYVDSSPPKKPKIRKRVIYHDNAGGRPEKTRNTVEISKQMKEEDKRSEAEEAKVREKLTVL